MKTIFKLRNNVNYNTKQKSKVLTFIKNSEKDFTTKDIYNNFNGKIGLTTIYRFVESLEKDGIILRVPTSNHTARYQYVEPCDRIDHFYLKCTSCGSLKHADCKKVKKFTAHISKKHHFIPANTKLIINGLCAECAEKGGL